MLRHDLAGPRYVLNRLPAELSTIASRSGCSTTAFAMSISLTKSTTTSRRSLAHWLAHYLEQRAESSSFDTCHEERPSPETRAVASL